MEVAGDDGVVGLVLGFAFDHPFATAVLLLVVLYQAWCFISMLTRPKNLPPMEQGWPLLGVALKFGMSPVQYATEMYKKHGEIFTLNVVGQRITFLVGPDAHVPFMKKNDDELDQNEPYQFAVPIFGPGVVYDTTVERRNQQLKFIKGSLSSAKLKSYVPLIVSEAEQFFAKWGQSGTVDLRKELSELIILTASRCLMGREIRETMFTEVAELYQTLDEGLTTLSVIWPNAPIPAHFNRNKARLELARIFGNVMRERRATPDVVHDDVLQVFMDAEYRDGARCSEEEVAGLMIALLFAGQHTSSITSTWTGLLLMDNPKLIPELLEEQKQVLAKHDGQLTFESLNDMVKLHNCVKEALRLWPPLIMVMRKVTQAFDYKQYHIPKGDTLFVSPAVSHRVDSVFSNADQFDPERFNREEDKQKPFSFIGFGGGRHGCMGEMFAYLQIKTIWSVLLRNFDMKLVGKLPEPDYSAMVVGPKHPCSVSYERL